MQETKLKTQSRGFGFGHQGDLASLVADSKESACQCRKPRFNPWVRKICWRKKWQPNPVFLPGEFNGPRRPAGYSP